MNLLVLLGRGIHRFTQLQITETKKHAKWHFVFCNRVLGIRRSCRIAIAKRKKTFAMAAVNMMPPSGLEMSPALRACPAFAPENWFRQKAAQLLAWVWCCLTELATMSTEKQNEVMANHYEKLVKELRPEESPTALPPLRTSRSFSTRCE